jgi:hypothetical protein
MDEVRFFLALVFVGCALDEAAALARWWRRRRPEAA